MNENLDLTKILEGCPYGTRFYCTEYGEVILTGIDIKVRDYNPIKLLAISKKGHFDMAFYLSKEGKNNYLSDGECLLFPSKEQRDWSKFERFWDKPKVEKFDPKTLQPFDKVLVRKIHSKYNIEPWSCEYFSYINPNTKHLVNGISSRYEICIPYNEETKHLLGTNEDCPEYYKWWD